MYGGVRVIIVRLFIDPANSKNMLPVQSVAKTMAVGSRSVWRLHDSMFVKLKINICSLHRKPVGQSTGNTILWWPHSDHQLSPLLSLSVPAGRLTVASCSSPP